MAVQINNWEDGANEGRFDDVAEAKNYVLENEMDVVIYTIRGNFRFNATIHENTEIRKIAEALKAEEIRGWTEEDYTETAKSLYKAGIRSVK